jgi:hypothetical protein
MKTFKSLKTVLSLSLVLSMALSSLASADASAMTPEAHLISSAIALSGRNLSASDLQNRIAAELKDYNETAPADHRIERTQQALVDMNILSPAQAQAFAAQAQESANTLASDHFATQQDAQNAFQSQLGQVLSTAKGARFDADVCDISQMVFLGSFVGGAGIALIVGGNAADTIASVAMGLMITSFVVGGLTCF